MDQLNQLLYKICQVKKVKVLDILGLKISDRELPVSLTVTGKFINIWECSGIYFSHLEREQAASMGRDIFHFLRHPAEVSIRLRLPGCAEEQGAFKVVTGKDLCINYKLKKDQFIAVSMLKS